MSEHEKERAFSCLSRPDAAIDDNVPVEIPVFLAAGGTPQGAISALVNGWRGYPALLDGLLELDLPTLLSQSEHAQVDARFEGQARGVAVLEECRTAEPPLTPSLWQVVTSEWAHQIRDRIDAQKIDDAVRRGGGGVPVWLSELLADESGKGRTLLFQLAREHPTSLSLQLAVREAASHGWDPELASLPTARAFLPVFSRIFREALARGAWTELQELANSSGPARLYVLSAAASWGILPLVTEPPASVWEQLPQIEVEFALYLDLIFTGDTVAEGHFVLAQALARMLATKEVSIINVTLLDTHYGGRAPTSADDGPPPAAWLRRADFRELCASVLFQRSSKAGQTASVRLDGASEDRLLRLIALAHADSADSALATELANALVDTVHRCRAAPMTGDASLVDRVTPPLSKFPLVAWFTLQWLRSVLLDPAYQLATLDTPAFTQHMTIVRAVVDAHPLLWEDAVSLVVDGVLVRPDHMDAMGVLAARKRSLSTLVQLLLGGAYVQVFAGLLHLAKEGTIDASLLRGLLLDIADAIEPPFSTHFADEVAQLLTHPAMAKVVSGASSDGDARFHLFIGSLLRHAGPAASDRLMASSLLLG